MALLAPSILSADFTNIQDAVRIAEDAGADIIHVDIMDGHFVPGLTFGPQLVSAIKEKTSLPVDVHLMVDNPAVLSPLFIDAGADWISIHVEASIHLQRDIQIIKDKGLKAGVALNPATPIHTLQNILHDLDYVLLMTVNPGWGGQTFIESSHRKISHLRSWIKGQKLDTLIEIDGGVETVNMDQLLLDGTDVFVAGSSIYKSDDPAGTIAQMKAILSRGKEKE
ncbi:MAG: ribulose-phosphate 3-epimerase [Acidobacteria bacterium]|nr:ribulose-phosphate 3-epimerase [Acidobacteriota bacterium]MBU1337495.1 ribulose-phosphate 3-epimerase [Acidobacteriota bacterium]MBU1474799.1 ribulose-phosphate 3-epimerase [Acidobacteriota bacterium]MBU2437528.1 ribulose-phosphate 3-epimerase [Acidobacteriota bacterium]MBU4203814.1 ribulose-phosphate 3-epimerase [Acidobacteriota bacterium]